MDCPVRSVDYAVNNILYQRGLYPADSFQYIRKYGCGLYENEKQDIKTYLQDICKQAKCIALLRSPALALTLLVIFLCARSLPILVHL